jgi:DMSO/TMAO reductase YedYZ molybdopterin-dependent catalytic subunit
VRRATDPTAEILIAYEMNGEPLHPDHGAPFRLIVPHWYAVASVKRLKRINVLTEPFVGEFQTGHDIYEWPDRPHERVSLMRVRARITDPAPGAVLPAGTHTVRGKAWSGTGPTDVHVSLTGAGEWYPATLEAPKGAPYQWQDWSFEWNAEEAGRKTLRARQRRSRKRRARRPTVEPPRLRNQRNRGHLRRRAMTVGLGSTDQAPLGDCGSRSPDSSCRGDGYESEAAADVDEVRRDGDGGHG